MMATMVTFRCRCVDVRSEELQTLLATHREHLVHFKGFANRLRAHPRSQRLVAAVAAAPCVVWDGDDLPTADPGPGPDDSFTGIIPRAAALRAAQGVTAPWRLVAFKYACDEARFVSVWHGARVLTHATDASVPSSRVRDGSGQGVPQVEVEVLYVLVPVPADVAAPAASAGAAAVPAAAAVTVTDKPNTWLLLGAAAFEITRARHVLSFGGGPLVRDEYELSQRRQGERGSGVPWGPGVATGEDAGDWPCPSWRIWRATRPAPQEDAPPQPSALNDLAPCSSVAFEE